MGLQKRRWLAHGKLKIFGLIAVSLLLAHLSSISFAAAGVDVQVSDPTTDTPEQTTQNETAIIMGDGVLCAGFNDFGPNGLSGWARSTDFGANWTDLGGINERGDPVLAYHEASDTFYYASLGNSSIRINASTDDCQTWNAAVNASTIFANTTLADKPWIAVDNTGGANDGNLYVCWTRFIDTDVPPDGNSDTSEMRFVRSTDGGATFVNEQVIVPSGTGPFGCNVQVDSAGNVNVVYADRNDFDIDFIQSTDGGVSFGGSVQVNSAATRQPGTDTIVTCGGGNRPTLTGNIRMLHQAWMAADTTGGPNDGNLYVVWASDPAGTPDNSDVFFSRSTDGGATWSAQVQIGAGGGATDQFEPNVAVSDTGDVSVVWYDRRNDSTNNTNIDVYTVFSSDGGATFGSLVRVTDQSFGVPPLNPNFNTGAAQCYMGEYIAIDGAGGGFYYMWGDNRNTLTTTNFPAGRLDPDVFFDVFPGPSNVVPTVSVDAASGDEGSAIALSATVGGNADGDVLVYQWTITPDAGTDAGAACTLTGATTLSPTATCSDNGTYTMMLTVTGDPAGPVSGSETLTISNVAPDVTADSGLTTTIDEGEFFDMLASFSDPGWNDTYTGSINWGIGEPDEAEAPVVTASGPPEDQGAISGSKQYGDNGLFTVTATVTDDNGGEGDDAVDVTVNNVAPTAEIDLTGAIDINGVPTFLISAGDQLDLTGRSTDPGSDDLYLRWDWGDGSPVELETSLVNNPAVEPLTPSPSVQPRDVTDSQSHVFSDACLYQVSFWSTDDDGGVSETAVVNVIVVGNADEARSAGYWLHQYRGNGNTDFDNATLECYLDIVGYMSLVFDEARDASTIANAVDILFVKQNQGSMTESLDQQLLAAWLNFANGAIGLTELVDTDGDTVPDTTFADAITAAEAVRLDPTATRDQLEEQKDILERINTLDK